MCLMQDSRCELSVAPSCSAAEEDLALISSILAAFVRVYLLVVNAIYHVLHAVGRLVCTGVLHVS